MTDWTDGIGDEPQDMFEPKIIFVSPWENTGNWKENCEIIMSKTIPELPPPDPTGTLNGTWCKKLRSGKYANLLHPTPDMVDLDDISFSLHNQCRYNGHTPFYSVAEHSCLAAYLASIDGRSMDEVRAVLAHDSAECYLGDMNRVLKLLLRSLGVTAYDELSAKWDKAIGERLGVDLVANHEVIKHYDYILMKAEKKRFWPDDKEEWACLESVPDRSIPWVGCSPSSTWFRDLARDYGIK